MRLFSGNAHLDLGERISEKLPTTLGNMEVGSFADGETKVTLREDVRGLDVFILQPTGSPTNHNLMELLVMCDAFRRASARRITAVIPYYGYARQDRKHTGRVPISAKLVANLIEAAGVDRVLCMDLHANQIQGFFDIPVDHLPALPLFTEYLRGKDLDNPCVLSPDIGSVKRASSLASRLNIDMAIIEKRRISDTEVESGHVIGDVKGRDILILDDMISTGGSMANAIKVAKENGAKKVIAMATHGLFVGEALNNLRLSGVDEIVVTDTVEQSHIKGDLPIVVLSVADLLGEAITRIHRDKSVTALFR